MQDARGAEGMSVRQRTQQRHHPDETFCVASRARCAAGVRNGARSSTLVCLAPVARKGYCSSSSTTSFTAGLPATTCARA